MSKRRNDPREMSLKELRQELARLYQEDVAEMLDVTQGYVSRLERRRDLRLSQLREYVRVLGGELVVRVRFGNEEIAISGLR